MIFLTEVKMQAWYSPIRTSKIKNTAEIIKKDVEINKWVHSGKAVYWDPYVKKLLTEYFQRSFELNNWKRKIIQANVHGSTGSTKFATLQHMPGRCRLSTLKHKVSGAFTAVCTCQKCSSCRYIHTQIFPVAFYRYCSASWWIYIMANYTGIKCS